MININDFNYLQTNHAYPIMINGKLGGYVENKYI